MLGVAVATHNAKNGTWLRDENGMYTWDGEVFPSVTTILKVVGKPALLFWAANEVAKAACLLYMDGTPVDETHYDKLRNAPWDNRDAKAAIGTSTHDVLERAAKKLPFDLADYEADVRPYAESALAWFNETKPTVLLTERACFSRRYGYAGTSDGFFEIDGRVLCLDYKTSKESYEDHAMQLAAYRNADFVAGDDGSELPVPKTDGGAILVIQPDRSKLYEWDCGEETFKAFLSVKHLYDWKASKPKRTLLNRKKRSTKAA